MSRPKERAIARRRAILELIRKSGFCTLPRQADLAKQLGVSQKQISDDLKAIADDIPPESTFLVDLEYRNFVKKAKQKLQGQLEHENPKIVKDAIFMINQLMKDEIIIRQRLGVIAPPPQDKLKASITLKWSGKKIGETQIVPEPPL